MTNSTDDLGIAFRLADIADRITTQRYLSRDMRVMSKPDLSPVTEADLEVESALSQVVTGELGDGYVGEEGARLGSSSRMWVVDPIDGTKNYVRGMPIWATLIALAHDGEPIVSVVSAPALRRRWWASSGGGAWTNDIDDQPRRLTVSAVASLSDAFVLYGSLFSWEKTDVGLDRIIHLLRTAWRHRSVGDFLGHMLVAEGAADACFEPDLRHWDLAPVALVVREAGGRVWSNVAAGGDPAAPRISITSNAVLHDEVYARMGVGQ